MSTVPWCYPRNDALERDGINDETAADLTGRANHVGVTIEADLTRQKRATCNGGYRAVDVGETESLVYSELATDHPMELWERHWCVAISHPRRQALAARRLATCGRSTRGSGRVDCLGTTIAESKDHYGKDET